MYCSNSTYRPPIAAIYSQARPLLDWNMRNPFCGQCGQRTVSVNAGTKRVCPPTDLAGGKKQDRLPCATRGTISNLSFPRTDPTVIMAVLSADGTKALLGRQNRWPPHMYSALAGFLEPGESIEEAVRREVWEESGVRVGRVAVHSSQPWPFPANLMIGAVGQALPGDGEKIHLGHDPELQDAKWVRAFLALPHQPPLLCCVCCKFRFGETDLGLSCTVYYRRARGSAYKGIFESWRTGAGGVERRLASITTTHRHCQPVNESSCG
jgi:NADH pyrophosphatase NudC (nudix superfamily)